MLHYQKMHKGSLEAQNHAAEIKLRAERKLGELLKQTEKQDGGDAMRAQLHNETEVSPTLAEKVGHSRRGPLQGDRDFPDEVSHP